MIQIKNRITGLYDIRGSHGVNSWTNKMHKRGCWGCLSHAKCHVTQEIGGYSLYIDNIKYYLDSDFVIVNDDYSISIEPVATHVIFKLKEIVERYKGKNWIDQEKIAIAEKLIKDYSK